MLYLSPLHLYPEDLEVGDEQNENNAITSENFFESDFIHHPTNNCEWEVFRNVGVGKPTYT